MLVEKSQYHHGDLKRVLLETAEQLLEAHGVAGLSLRNVARQSGVSHTAPYRHFRDKIGLLSALAEIGFKRLAKAMTEVSLEYPEDPSLQLNKAGTAYVKLAVDHPEMTNLMFGGILKDCKGLELQRASDSAFEGLVGIIENGQKTGIFKPRATLDMVMAAWSTVHGLAMLISAGKLDEATNIKKSPEILATTVGEILISGMLNEK